MRCRSTVDGDAESHKNEGFFKSLWHNLTNHPAHRQDSESGKDDSGKSDDESKK